MSESPNLLHRISAALKVVQGEAHPDSARDVAALRLDLAERNEEVARLRKEYALQKEESRGQIDRAATEGIEGLIRQCAGPLATLSAMRARHREQGDVNPVDLFHVLASFEKILAERGLQPIGVVGEEAPYDPSLHQMLDGSRPQPGEPVQIRFAGYRFKGKLIAKAQAGAPSLERSL
ncbi:MAG: nucleotide exchange factor GrpE [Chlorobiaceae bacterium]|nr:nucleotide exchange factor GrpE [Chlorobiaceae bacterium]